MARLDDSADRLVPRTRIKPTLRLVDFPPGAERRGAPRFTLLIRTAKLIAEGDEFLCVVRDASQLGIRVKIFHPLPKREGWAIELCNGQRYDIVEIWQRDELAGFRFPEPVPLEKLLQYAPPDRSRRPMRLNCKMPGTLFTQSGQCDITFRNISQQGACIESSLRLTIGESFLVESDIMPVISAQVRWRHGNLYGVALQRTFAYRELAGLCLEDSERRKADELAETISSWPAYWARSLDRTSPWDNPR